MKENSNTYYLYAIIITIVAYIINDSNIKAASIALFLFGAVLSIVNVKKGLLFFFFISLAFSDFTFEGVFGAGSGEEGAKLGGVYMASFGGLTIMVLWSLILFIVLFSKKIAFSIKKINSNFFFKIFIIVFVFSFLGMVFNVTSSANYAVQTAFSDVRIFVNTIVGFLTIHVLVNSKKELIVFFNCFVIILVTQLAITIVSSYIISSTRTISNFFSGTESYLAGVIFLYVLMNLINNKGVGIFKRKLFLISVMLIIILFSLIVASRGRLLGLVVAILIYMVFSKKIGYVLLLPVLMLASINIVELINPNFYNYFMWKINTFNPGEGDSSRVRYISLINIMYELLENPYYLVFGKGLGGYFEAIHMPFDIALGKGSFNLKWIAEGKFYKPHGIIMYSLLKYGLVMSSILFFSVGQYVSKNLFKSFRQADNILKYISIALLINIPFIFITMFSSKLQIMFGMVVAFAQISITLMKIEKKDRLNA
ncbi:hypothetical protein LPB136_06575 [Tenacibaculum todarodis]|uniref:O-antigen polymerase n=1 Tax=Tenacibaculum todarodis TaxID=1850252 RepID=A0A1L3JIX7_9FLAO|nr:hypothetical protein [Tenacibaculum todarodis]APG65042.1 hypothetical protein LPB136_06575 [Tenacibaculum todarodis]